MFQIAHNHTALGPVGMYRIRTTKITDAASAQVAKNKAGATTETIVKAPGATTKETKTTAVAVITRTKVTINLTKETGQDMVMAIRTGLETQEDQVEGTTKTGLKAKVMNHKVVTRINMVGHKVARATPRQHLSTAPKAKDTTPDQGIRGINIAVTNHSQDPTGGTKGRVKVAEVDPGIKIRYNFIIKINE